MAHGKRVFILGAGFSRPAGMPLATELLPLLVERLPQHEMRDWLNDLQRRLCWLSGNPEVASSFRMNIEEVFHIAHSEIETHRLKQHLAPVGRGDGPGTAWNMGRSVASWLQSLEEELQDVILDADGRADLEPITRWAKSIELRDTVITFNYDRLVERALSACGKDWNHAVDLRNTVGIPVCKLHGSIDWIVAKRKESFSKLDLLFDKPNANRRGSDTGHVEDDCRLWRCRSDDQTRNWIDGRHLQNGEWKTVGIAGLGAYKQLHLIPGLGEVWSKAMRDLYQADVAVVVGFSMSDFDTMAQIQFAEVAMKRHTEHRPLPVIVIDPFLSDTMMARFRRVFQFVEFVGCGHETVNWSRFDRHVAV